MTLHTLLKSHIELNNKIIGIIDNLQLVNNDINIPDIQRIVDDDNVDDIVNYQINYYKKYNKFNFIGLINIHCLKNHLKWKIKQYHIKECYIIEYEYNYKIHNY